MRRGYLSGVVPLDAAERCGLFDGSKVLYCVHHQIPGIDLQICFAQDRELVMFGHTYVLETCITTQTTTWLKKEYHPVTGAGDSTHQFGDDFNMPVSYPNNCRSLHHGFSPTHRRR